MTPIPPDKAASQIGNLVHVLDWPKGCCFTLEKIEGENAHLITPKSRKRYTMRVDRLAYTRRNAPSQEKNNG